MEKNNKVSDVCLERFILGELPDNRSKEIEHLVQTDESLKQRINDIKDSNKEFIDKYPVEVFSNIIKSRQRREKEIGRSKIFTFSFLKIAAPVFSLILVVSIFMFTKSGFFNDNEIYYGLKGSSQEIFIFRNNDIQNELLEKKSVVYKNDLIQLKYRSVENNYGVIFSVDGNLKITKHFPSSLSSKDTVLKRGETVPLENSYLLDDAPEYEIFYLITSNKPVDVLYIENRLNTYVQTENDLLKGKFELNKSYRVTVFPLLKGTK